MPVDWNEMQKEMYPIKDYGAMRQRWRDAFAYSFVCNTYNFTILKITDYTQRLLGKDTHNRYTDYTQRLVETFNRIHQVSVRDIMDLVSQVDTCEQFEAFMSHQKTIRQ